MRLFRLPEVKLINTVIVAGVEKWDRSEVTNWESQWKQCPGKFMTLRGARRNEGDSEYKKGNKRCFLIPGTFPWTKDMFSPLQQGKKTWWGARWHNFSRKVGFIARGLLDLQYFLSFLGLAWRRIHLFEAWESRGEKDGFSLGYSHLHLFSSCSRFLLFFPR